MDVAGVADLYMEKRYEISEADKKPFKVDISLYYNDKFFSFCDTKEWFIPNIVIIDSKKEGPSFQYLVKSKIKNLFKQIILVNHNNNEVYAEFREKECAEKFMEELPGIIKKELDDKIMDEYKNHLQQEKMYLEEKRNFEGVTN